ncbi:hypothetical protein ACEWY4_010798 [Coilia grayii]|uniref:C-Jun-amino-terminal kinase-interacting protein 1 n=1 Tax=Coilia grayii TaxID=363190 RepID=A0ABD1K2Y2_9TELE
MSSMPSLVAVKGTLKAPLCYSIRLTHDISLEEYEDDDLSEVTEIGDEHGPSPTFCTVDVNGHMSVAANGAARTAQRRRGVVELQSEMLHLDLIDAEEGGIQEDDEWQQQEEEERRTTTTRRKEEAIDAVRQQPQRQREREEGPGGAAPPDIQQPLLREPALTAMDTYRPKRPTTLNLFPQVPRTQDTINNNSFGDKDRRKEKGKEKGKEKATGEQGSHGGKIRERTCSKHSAGGSTSTAAHRAGGGVDSKAQKKPSTAQHPKPSAAQSNAAAAATATATATANATATTTAAKPAMRETMGAPVREQVHSCHTSVASVEASVEKAHYHRVNGSRETVRYPGANGAVYREQERYPRYFGGADMNFIDVDDDQPEEEEDEEEVIRLSPMQHRNGGDSSSSGRPSLSQSSDSNRMSLSSDSEAPPPCPQHHHSHPHHHSHNHNHKPSISEEDEDEDGVYPPTPPRRTVSLSEAVGRETAWRTIAEVDEDEEEEEAVVVNGASVVTGVGVAAPAGLVAAVAAGTEGGAKAATAEAEGKPTTAEPAVSSSDARGLTYDSVKYTLVVDEGAQLELVSLKQCYKVYQDSDSDDNTVYESALEEEEEREGEERAHRRLKREQSSGLSAATTTDSSSDAPRSRKFRNVFANGHASSLSGAESFGLFSCVIGGKEREQSHRAVFRFVPRHEDELELEADDPLLLEAQAEDLWCEAYNMRTGIRGIFPAFYAVKVVKETTQTKEEKGDWVDTFWVKFLGSVQVPYHKGNDVLCAAMQKIATNRRLQMQFSPSVCVVEINLRGVKIIVKDDCRTADRGDKCCHFFQLKNISFCGCHPKNKKYFGLITKHPAYQRFACHVFFSEESTAALAESVGKAFQQYYKEHMAYSCPTEDIFLE